MTGSAGDDQVIGMVLNSQLQAEPIPAGVGMVIAVAHGDRPGLSGSLVGTSGEPPSGQVSYIVRSDEGYPYEGRRVLWLVDVRAEDEPARHPLTWKIQEAGEDGRWIAEGNHCRIYRIFEAGKWFATLSLSGTAAVARGWAPTSEEAKRIAEQWEQLFRKREAPEKASLPNTPAVARLLLLPLVFLLCLDWRGSRRRLGRGVCVVLLGDPL